MQELQDVQIFWAERNAWPSSLKQAQMFSAGEGDPSRQGGDIEQSEHLFCSWKLAAACSVMCEPWYT